MAISPSDIGEKVPDQVKKALGIPSPTVFSFTDTNGTKQTIVLDCTIKIATSTTSKVTNFPVERGFDVSDHIIRNPLQLKIEGCISEAPTKTFYNIFKGIFQYGLESIAPPNTGISNAFVQQAVASGIALGIGGAIDSTNPTYGEGTIMGILQERKYYDFDYPKRMMRALLEMSKQGIVIDVETYFNKTDYKSMVIRQANFTQDAKIADSLNFNLDCVEMRVVDTKVTENVAISKTEGTVKDPASTQVQDEVDKSFVIKKKPKSALFFTGEQVIGAGS